MNQYNGAWRICGPIGIVSKDKPYSVFDGKGCKCLGYSLQEANRIVNYFNRNLISGRSADFDRFISSALNEVIYGNGEPVKTQGFSFEIWYKDWVIFNESFNAGLSSNSIFNGFAQKYKDRYGCNPDTSQCQRIARWIRFMKVNIHRVHYDPSESIPVSPEVKSKENKSNLVEIDAIVVDALPGTDFTTAVSETITMSIARRRDIILLFNGKAHVVSFNELINSINPN